MATLKPLEQLDAGGVDSRSNPINMPRNRALRCLNWVPKQAGFWELRWGYSTVSMSTVTASAITGLFPFRLWNGTKYVLFVQGTTLSILNTSNGTVTTPTVYGAAFASSAKGMTFVANNHLHYGNGTDQKFFDGNFWFDSGIPPLTAAQVQNVTVTEGVRELKPSEASTVTLTAAGGGTFPADTLTGHLIYVAIYDTSLDVNNYAFAEIGPATISVSAGRIKLTANQEIQVGNLPNLSTVNTNWVKLIGGTIDGGNLAWFFTNTSTPVSSVSVVGQVATVGAVGHGLSVGDVVIIAGTSGNLYDGVWYVQSTGVNQFTFNIKTTTSLNGVPAGGTIKRIVQANNAATSVNVTAPTQDTSYQVNQNIGLPASTIGGPNPGYQFYASIYSIIGAIGSSHVSNRIAIGGRLLQTAYRCNVRVAGLPQLASIYPNNPSYTFLFGRTGDGAQVPYVCSDNVANWIFIPSANVTPLTYFTITAGNIDGQHELPTRNGVIPSQCNMFCLAGDYAYAGDTGSPFLRRSGSFADYRASLFTGLPEQSWAADDIDTFPTAEALTGMFEVDQEVFCGTLHDCAISTNAAGIQQWIGPWAVGIAGRRAGTKCGSHGFCWLSGDKQLCTFQEGVPVIISDEYELAELSQIADQFLSTTELVYYRNAQQNKDELRIEGQLSNGTPYTVIHDFKLREVFTAPGSIYGQGYSSQFLGPLGTAFTVGQIRDGNGKLQVYAGASNGQLYQLYSGADDVGNQYPADLILLINAGPNRPSVPFIDWYGDGNINISIGQTLSTTLAVGSDFSFEPLTPSDNPAQSVPGSENDFLFRSTLTQQEIRHVYMRFQLTSHSTDGNLSLNSPPHLPLENYGRLYAIIPTISEERGI